MALVAWYRLAAGPIVSSEFIADPPATPFSHASTIVDTPSGLVAAWAGGSGERKPDVGIWLSRAESGHWTPPVQVAAGIERYQSDKACWNPVLFQPKDQPLCLFYKVGPKPEHWWGKYLQSRDQGRTWSKPKRLPNSYVGPVRNKPVQLADGTILCGASTENSGWKVHMERLRLPFWDWTATRDLNEGTDLQVIQPTIIPWSNSRIQILCRSKQGVLVESTSADGGLTWSPMNRTTLPNPNGAVDAVLLNDGRALLVHNPSNQSRGILRVSVSSDGATWTPLADLEDGDGEYSYPAVIQGSDGMVHITYSWKRQRIKHAVVNPSKTATP